MISQNIKKQIIDQTNIVEVVGEVVKLTKKGSSYFGLCPFHNDNNPSMSVNNEKKMLRIVVASNQTRRICEIIKNIDENSFTTLLDVKQVNGNFYLPPIK